MVFTTRGLRYKRQAVVIASALFVLITLSGKASLTPVGAAPTNQTPSQPTPTARPILLTDPVPDPEQQGVQYFPQTGHTLRGVILDYWNRYGGLAQFGYPLTEEFFEPIGGDNMMYQVQYFERNRFELHPEDKGTQFEVLLGVLSRDFRQQDPPATPQPAPAVYFQETGHNLSGAFKSYWETHDGLFVHGFPITEPYQERNPVDGKTYQVQYFERSRFELHPENAGTPYEMLLGLLGRQLSEKKGYPYGWYPSYGWAADYSWVAGWVVAQYCGHIGPLTVYIVYERVSPTKQVTGKVLELVSGSGRKAAYDLTKLHGFHHGIVFGRSAKADDPSPVCKDLLKGEGYVVNSVQSHPAQEEPVASK